VSIDAEAPISALSELTCPLLAAYSPPSREGRLEAALVGSFHFVAGFICVHGENQEPETTTHPLTEKNLG
jgi:hypothetical protein